MASASRVPHCWNIVPIVAFGGGAVTVELAIVLLVIVLLDNVVLVVILFGTMYAELALRAMPIQPGTPPQRHGLFLHMMHVMKKA